MNPVLILTRNCLDLTKRCVQSIRAQDIDCTPQIVDNGSTDDTQAWAAENGIFLACYHENIGVTKGWNRGLANLFDYSSIEHVLCVGNDTWLPSSLYRNMLSVNFPFVTGVAVDNMEQALQPPCIFPLTPNPDFSCFLIRREAWEKIGEFDKGMVHYSSDQDYHIRGWRKGVEMMKASIPFYHERSSTLRLAPEQERTEIEAQASKDRAMLFLKWGVSAGGPDYEAMFTPATFGIDR